MQRINYNKDAAWIGFLITLHSETLESIVLVIVLYLLNTPSAQT